MGCSCLARRRKTARAVGLVASCAVQMAEGPERAETVFAVTGSNQLVSFSAGRPSSVMKKMPIANLRTGESIMGIDFRPADGRLYALASSGRLEWSNGVLECWSTGFPTTQRSITPSLQYSTPTNWVIRRVIPGIYPSPLAHRAHTIHRYRRRAGQSV